MQCVKSTDRWELLAVRGKSVKKGKGEKVRGERRDTNDRVNALPGTLWSRCNVTLLIKGATFRHL
jgi:hypothetical protein